MIKIAYACASVRAHTSAERRTVNLDFKLEGSSQFNKLVFKLTTRHREYMANIVGEADEHWPRHQHLIDTAKDLRQTQQIWIGKAQPRQQWRKGAPSQTPRMQCTGAFLVNEPSPGFVAYIEDWEISIPLEISDNPYYSLKGEWRNPEVAPVSVRGQWV